MPVDAPRPGEPVAWRARAARLTRERAGAAAVLLIAALFVLLQLPQLGRAADDAGMVAVLSADEALSVRIVRHMLVERTLDPGGFFAYGALVHDLAALVLAPAAVFALPSDRAIIITLRALALLSGAGVVAATGWLGGRLGGGAVAVLAALFVAVVPELGRWSVTAHPDTLQLACLTAGLVAAGRLAEGGNPRWALAGGALAGAAFSAKYAGLLLLPLLALALAAGCLRAEARWLPRRFAVRALLIGGAFAAVFALTNPYALATPRAAAAQLRAELAHAGAGHVFDEDNGGLRWLRTAGSTALGGPALALLAAVGVGLLRPPVVAASGSALARRLGRVNLGTLAVLWAGGYLLYLILRVGYGAPRHALPVVPVVAALAAYAAVALASWWSCSRLAFTAALLAVAAVTVSLPALAAVDAGRDRLRAAAALAADPRVLAGRWLAANLPPDAPVLADAYVYIPPGFTRVTVTFGLTEVQVAALAPRVIAVNEDIRGRFRWDIGAERYVDGPAAYGERQAAYATLEEGALPCYALAQDLGSVQLYQRTCP